jgi:hypothetical protein
VFGRFEEHHDDARSRPKFLPLEAVFPSRVEGRFHSGANSTSTSAKTELFYIAHAKVQNSLSSDQSPAFSPSLGAAPHN